MSRGAFASDDVETWRTIAALERFAARVGEGGHRAAAQGLAQLYRGNVDAALELLRDAVFLEPQEPSYACDLAAAALTRGRPTDLLEALNFADEALHLDPNLDAALFNRALGLERLGLFEAARASWIAVATRSIAAEADVHLFDIDQRLRDVAQSFSTEDLLGADHERLFEIVQQSLDQVRSALEGDLVPKLGHVCEADKAQCAKLLQRVQVIARTMSDVSPDGQPAALADQLGKWGVLGLKNHATRLKSYGVAMELYEHDRVTESAALFAQLAVVQADTVTALRSNAILYTCLDNYFRAEHARARQCLDGLEQEANHRHFTFVLGRINWLRAQISLAEGNYGRASDEFDRAISFLRDARDVNQVAAVETLRATLLDQLGSLDEAWQDRISALTQAHLDARRRHTALNSAARSCLLQRFPRAALEFQDAALQHAFRWGQPGALVESHLNRAVILDRLQRPNEARSDLESAKRAIERVEDARARNRFEGELPVVEGELMADLSPADAIPVLDRASSRLTSMQFELLRARVELARGVAAEKIGALRQATAAYRRGADIVERQRNAVSAPSIQAQFLDVSWDVYEHLITRVLDDEGASAALAVTERSRAPTIDRNAAADLSDADSMTGLSALLPRGMTVLYFAVLENETVRWTISRSGETVARIPVGRQRLDYLVRRLRQILDTHSWNADLREASQPLVDLVLPRRREDLGTTLILVPDGALHDLPVAVLEDSMTGRHLIEDYAIGIAPSIRSFLAASQAARERFGALDAALIVRGRMGAAVEPPLSVLTDATDEIRFISETYRRSRVLAGLTATKDMFLAEVGKYPVVHFTGHAVADRMEPDLSRLFLEPAEASSNGWLLLRDLRTAHFDRTALVVLGACNTGAGRIFRGEGVITLARPFLEKGVAAVVNTLWDVADDASARLLTQLHAGVAAGLEPIVALQRAQREQIAHPDTSNGVHTWPAFQYVGGVRGQ